MKTYRLINQQGDFINKITTESYEDALEFFCEVKRLEVSSLLEIYKIVVNENRD